MIVLAPDQAEDGFNKHLERFKKIIEDGDGKIVNDDRWGIRSLAYPIKKYDQGFYTVIEWESTPDLLTELHHTLRLEEKVLRHMVIHLDSTALEELAEMRAKKAERPSGSQVDPVVAEKDDSDGTDVEVDKTPESDSDDKAEPAVEPDVEPEAEPDVEPEAEPEEEPDVESEEESEAESEEEPDEESSESDASEEADPGDTGEVDAEEAEEEEK